MSVIRYVLKKLILKTIILRQNHAQKKCSFESLTKFLKIIIFDVINSYEIFYSLKDCFL